MEFGQYAGKIRAVAVIEKGLTVSRKPLKMNGAGDEIRTHDINLGKVAEVTNSRASASFRAKSGGKRGKTARNSGSIPGRIRAATILAQKRRLVLYAFELKGRNEVSVNTKRRVVMRWPYRGRMMTVGELVKASGSPVGPCTVAFRLKRGWSVDEALQIPPMSNAESGRLGAKKTNEKSGRVMMMDGKAVRVRDLRDLPGANVSRSTCNERLRRGWPPILAGMAPLGSRIRNL